MRRCRGRSLTHDDEKHGKDDEAHQLNGFTSPGVDQQKCRPITRDETSDRQDDVADRYVVKTLVYTKRAFLWGCAETDGGQDDGGIQTKAIESDLDT